MFLDLLVSSIAQVAYHVLEVWYTEEGDQDILKGKQNAGQKEKRI